MVPRTTTPKIPAFLANPTIPATPESGAGCGVGSGDCGAPAPVLLPGVTVPLLPVAEGGAPADEDVESVAVGEAAAAEEVVIARSTPALAQNWVVNSTVPVVDCR